MTAPDRGGPTYPSRSRSRRPSIAAAAIFLFVIHWNELLYPLLFIQSPGNRTLPLALLSFQGEFQTNYPLLFAGVILASLPVVVAYVFLQRYFVAGHHRRRHQGMRHPPAAAPHLSPANERQHT